DIKCDIIIPVWNEYELTKKCVESIEKNTALSYSIILVDNASDAQTAAYLKELAKKNPAATTLIRNEENSGFPGAVNQGIAVSNAPFLCILNNDTKVYKGWLEEMIRVAEKEPAIGIVNPSSNNLGQAGPLEGFSGKWIEMSAGIGFCMLIKKEVVEKIGMFDEIYSPGNFEDTDFSRRAVKAGYKCVMAKGAYVYHVQNTGFKKRKDWDEKFKRNLAIFNKRWGRTKRIAYVVKSAEENDLKAAEGDIRGFLKNGDRVYVFLKNRNIASCLGEHCSLRIFELGSFMFGIKVFWRIVTRKKKFDRIITLRVSGRQL
ncbi:MAG: glycosyltransferase family 2 protein, partial [Candidatus Omnitrophota bacterium]